MKSLVWLFLIPIPCLAQEVGLEGFLDAGVAPSGLAVQPDGKRVYVADSQEGVVRVFNVSTRQLITTLETGVGYSARNPRTSPDGSRLYVIAPPGRMVAMNVDTYTIWGFLDFGVTPSALEVLPDGKLVLVLPQPGNVSQIKVLDPNTFETLRTATVSSCQSVHHVVAHKNAIVVTGQPPTGSTGLVAVMGMAPGSPVRQGPSPSIPSMVRLNQAGTVAYLTCAGSGQFIAIDLDSDETIFQTGVPGVPFAFALDEENGMAWVLSDNPDVVLGIRTSDGVMVSTASVAGLQVGKSRVESRSDGMVALVTATNTGGIHLVDTFPLSGSFGGIVASAWTGLSVTDILFDSLGDQAFVTEDSTGGLGVLSPAGNLDCLEDAIEFAVGAIDDAFDKDLSKKEIKELEHARESLKGKGGALTMVDKQRWEPALAKVRNAARHLREVGAMTDPWQMVLARSSRRETRSLILRAEGDMGTTLSDARDEYMKGIEALKDRRWVPAIDFFKEAVHEINEARDGD